MLLNFREGKCYLQVIVQGKEVPSPTRREEDRKDIEGAAKFSQGMGVYHKVKAIEPGKGAHRKGVTSPGSHRKVPGSQRVNTGLYPCSPV